MYFYLAYFTCLFSIFSLCKCLFLFNLCDLVSNYIRVKKTLFLKLKWDKHKTKIYTKNSPLRI